MSIVSKIERFTADGASTIRSLRGIVFNSTTADTLDLRDGTSSGAILLTVGVAAAGTTVLDFAEGLTTPSGAVWFADVTTTGAPKITLYGN